MDLSRILDALQGQRILIDTDKQSLAFWSGGALRALYPISSAQRGLGERDGSWQTPRGRHCIYQKVGDNEPVDAVFVARKVTGEIYRPELSEKYPNRDWILTRILWLTGCERRNSFHPRKTRGRFIYIHGAPPETEFGRPGSHGCIRMKSQDLLGLFAVVREGCWVDII